MAASSRFRVADLGVEKWVKAVRDRARAEMADIAEGGEFDMKQTIETAVTDTGAARAGSGGHPGRIDTGYMYDHVGHRLEEYDDGFAAIWGWSDPEDYFLLQEYGTDQIDPMEALDRSLNLAEMDLRAKLKGMR